MKVIIEDDITGKIMCETEMDFVPPVGMVLMYDDGTQECTVKELYFDLDERVLYIFSK